MNGPEDPFDGRRAGLAFFFFFSVMFLMAIIQCSRVSVRFDDAEANLGGKHAHSTVTALVHGGTKTK